MALIDSSFRNRPLVDDHLIDPIPDLLRHYYEYVVKPGHDATGAGVIEVICERLIMIPTFPHWSSKTPEERALDMISARHGRTILNQMMRWRERLNNGTPLDELLRELFTENELRVYPL